jgi:hypothetical protein
MQITLDGQPEYPDEPYKQCANHAEILFTRDDVSAPPPRWLPGEQPGNHNVIRIWLHEFQFPLVRDILLKSKGVRCFYTERPGRAPEAGIKDWNPESAHEDFAQWWALQELQVENTGAYTHSAISSSSPKL